MKQIQLALKNFTGASYEVGVQIGNWVLSRPDLLDRFLMPPGAYPQDKFDAAIRLLNEYADGVNEEIQGFSDTVGISPRQAVYYAQTYLERGCSLMAALPSKIENRHTIMARNYDFNDEMEEMCFAYTRVDGKYSHIGSTLSLFGRSDGMNEHGLAVSTACNGLPVGNFEGGQPAGVTGFSFWVTARCILENCKNVDEAVEWTMNAPMGYNINLMVAGRDGRIALLQCIDGHKAYRILDETSSENYLTSTNHVLFPELKQYERMLIGNSVIRNDRMTRLFEDHRTVSCDDMKSLLSASYPEGLCCHYYREFFGTLRSMIFDMTDQTIGMTFGSPQANGWNRFSVEPLEEKEIAVILPQEKAGSDFYDITYFR